MPYAFYVNKKYEKKKLVQEGKCHCLHAEENIFPYEKIEFLKCYLKTIVKTCQQHKKVIWKIKHAKTNCETFFFM